MNYLNFCLMRLTSRGDGIQDIGGLTRLVSTREFMIIFESKVVKNTAPNLVVRSRDFYQTILLVLVKNSYPVGTRGLRL